MSNKPAASVKMDLIEFLPAPAQTLTEEDVLLSSLIVRTVFFCEAPTMDDRRSKPRLSVRLDAMWDSSTQAHSARVTDLSEGGCFLDSVGEVRRGEIVGFRVLMPDDDWLYLEGEVKHHSMKGFGVQFTELNEEQTEKLQWLLRIAQQAGPTDAPISADLVEE